MAAKKSPKIDQTLQKLVESMSKASSPSSSSTEPLPDRRGQAGDPNCPRCGGIGYLRADVPVEHPDFGRIRICDCRQAQVSQQVRQRLFQLSHLDELDHLTFENFQPRGKFGLLPRQADSLENAYNQSRLYAQSLKGWLLLQGSYGCGKTHLAAAIANFTVSIGVPTLFITVPDLLDTLRFAYNDPESSFEARFEQIRQAPLLVLDDFGTQNATPWAQEKLFQIMNYRYVNRLPLVVTTNLDERDFEERIQSRLQDPELVTRVRILSPDFRDPHRDIGHHALSSLDLLANRTFANFDLRQGEGLDADHVRSLQTVLQAAQKFASHPQGWMVLLGPYGCGKTHLAAAIANFRYDLGDPPLFVVMPDLLDHLRATFSPNSSVTLDRRFEEVREHPLLILDDLGTQSATPWVKEKIYQLFNYRYNAEMPTVITSADKLEDMDPRIRSRMLDQRLCSIYAITAPGFTGRETTKSPPASPPAKSSRSKQTSAHNR